MSDIQKDFPRSNIFVKVPEIFGVEQNTIVKLIKEANKKQLNPVNTFEDRTLAPFPETVGLWHFQDKYYEKYNWTGKGAYFDGINANGKYLYLPNSDTEFLTSLNTFSIILKGIVKHDTGGNIISKGSSYGSGFRILTTLSTGKITIGAYYDTIGTINFVANNVLDYIRDSGEFELIISFVDGLGIYVFFNGKRVGFYSITNSLVHNTSAGLLISGDSGGVPYFKGLLKEVAIKNTSLDTAQIATYSNNGILPSNLIAYWRFDNTNTFLNDLSGNGHTLINSNGVKIINPVAPNGMTFLHNGANILGEARNTNIIKNSGGENTTDFIDTDGDGIADEWGFFNNPGSIQSINTIVTGNGFTGNAQRFEISPGATDFRGSMDYIKFITDPIIGEVYILTFEYRAKSSSVNKNFNIIESTGWSNVGFSHFIGENTGNAKKVTLFVKFTKNDGTFTNGGFTLQINGGQPGDYVEIGNIHLSPAINPVLYPQGFFYVENFNGVSQFTEYSPTLKNSKIFTADGINDNFIMSNPKAVDFLLQTENFTIDFWIKTDYTSNSQAIMEIYEVSAATRLLKILVNNQKIEFQVYLDIPGNPPVVIDSGSLLVTDGLWHHVSCSYDHINLKINIDGNLISTVAETRNFPVFVDTDIVLSLLNAQWYFNGQIDSLRFTKKALTDEEIASTCLVGRYWRAGTDSLTVNDNSAINVDKVNASLETYRFIANSNADGTKRFTISTLNKLKFEQDKYYLFEVVFKNFNLLGVSSLVANRYAINSGASYAQDEIPVSSGKIPDTYSFISKGNPNAGYDRFAVGLFSMVENDMIEIEKMTVYELLDFDPQSKNTVLNLGDYVSVNDPEIIKSLEDSLLLHYPMTEEYGDFGNSGSNKKDLTFNKFGISEIRNEKSYIFDGGYIESNDFIPKHNNGQSYSIWFRVGDITPQQVLFTHEPQNGANGNGGAVRCLINPASSSNQLIIEFWNGITSLGNWLTFSYFFTYSDFKKDVVYHLVINQTGNTITAFIDGRKLSTVITTDPTPTFTNGIFRIGKDITGQALTLTGGWNILNARIYNKELSILDILNLIKIESQDFEIKSGMGNPQGGIFNGNIIEKTLQEIEFDGINDYIPHLMDSPEFNSLWIDGWMYFDGTERNGLVISKRSAVDTSYVDLHSTLITNVNSLIANFSDGTNDVIIQTDANSLEPNHFHHIGLLIDRENDLAKLVIDGVVEKEITLPVGFGNITNNTLWEIGRTKGGSYCSANSRVNRYNVLIYNSGGGVPTTVLNSFNSEMREDYLREMDEYYFNS